MIGRMNKRQREAIQGLIRASIAFERDRDNESSLMLMDAEKEFEQCFANEDPGEDAFNHVEPT